MCQPCWMYRDWRGHGGSRWASVSMRQRLCGVEGDSILSPNRATAECVCVDSVCLRARRSLVHQAAKNLSQTEKLPDFEERRPPPASLGWLSAGDPASLISHFTSHCWSALARSRIKFGHPVVREATPSPLHPPPPDLK